MVSTVRAGFKYEPNIEVRAYNICLPALESLVWSVWDITNKSKEKYTFIINKTFMAIAIIDRLLFYYTTTREYEV